jgi:hypothetical protein
MQESEDDNDMEIDGQENGDTDSMEVEEVLSAVWSSKNSQARGHRKGTASKKGMARVVKKSKGILRGQANTTPLSIQRKSALRKAPRKPSPTGATSSEVRAPLATAQRIIICMRR